jgi:hypothetical protein
MTEKETDEAEKITELFEAYKRGGKEGIKRVLQQRNADFEKSLREQAEGKSERP